MGKGKEPVSCKGCGRQLPQAQIEFMIGDPKYNMWCREGFCSLDCFEKHGNASRYETGTTEGESRSEPVVTQDNRNGVLPTNSKAAETFIAERSKLAIASFILSLIAVFPVTAGLVGGLAYYSAFLAKVILVIIRTISSSVVFPLSILLALILAPIFGTMSLLKIRKSGGRLRGKRLAVAALVISTCAWVGCSVMAKVHVDTTENKAVITAMEEIRNITLKHRKTYGRTPSEKQLRSTFEVSERSSILDNMKYRAVWITPEATPQEILAYTPSNVFLLGKGYVVLRLNGNIEWLRKTEFEELLAQQQTLREKGQVSK